MAIKESPKMELPWWRRPAAQKTGWALLALFIIGLLVWYFHFRPYVATDDARVAATLVRLAPAGAGGQVIAVNAEEGEAVKQGQVLVELDHRAAQAQLLRAQAKANLSATEFKRIEQLARQNGVSARELDNARANAASAEAEQTLAQVALDNTYLKAPFNGVVVQKVAEVGNILEPGQAALTLADAEHAWIAANLEETRVGLVQPGQAVEVHVDEGGDLSGKVQEIDLATASQFSLIPSENASGNFTKLVQRVPIKVQLDPHPGHLLRAGQSVEIRIRVR